MSLLARGTSNVVAEGDGKGEPHGHGMPCPYSVVCHFERSEKSLNSRNGILHFTALRSV